MKYLEVPFEKHYKIIYQQDTHKLISQFVLESNMSTQTKTQTKPKRVPVLSEKQKDYIATQKWKKSATLAALIREVKWNCGRSASR